MEFVKKNILELNRIFEISPGYLDSMINKHRLECGSNNGYYYLGYRYKVFEDDEISEALLKKAEEAA
jgi:hypothetical protein